MKKTLITFVMAVIMGTGFAAAQPYFRHNGGSGPREPQHNAYSNYNPTPYKGFLELGYSFGVGDNRSDRLDILTTHGVKVSPSAFLGVGAGLSVAFNNCNEAYENLNGYHTTGVSIPLYVDARFMQPEYKSPYAQPFLDVKLGGQFRVSDDTFMVKNGFVDGTRSFFFSPTVGVRIPVGFKSAVNLGVTYNLTTYRIVPWERPDTDGETSALSSLGLRISYEW